MESLESLNHMILLTGAIIQLVSREREREREREVEEGGRENRMNHFSLSPPLVSLHPSTVTFGRDFAGIRQRDKHMRREQ